jgi:hypothetical protein
VIGNVSDQILCRIGIDSRRQSFFSFGKGSFDTMLLKGEMIMAEDLCAKCKLPKKDWKAFAGQGYTNPKDGQKYCCRQCAEGSGCMCK